MVSEELEKKIPRGAYLVKANVYVQEGESREAAIDRVVKARFSIEDMKPEKPKGEKGGRKEPKLRAVVVKWPEEGVQVGGDTVYENVVLAAWVSRT